MTPEAQRIAIAQACGWTDIRHDEIEGMDVETRQIYPWSGLRGMTPDKKYRLFIPDYLQDLNAMHEAEKVLLTKDGFCGCWETYSNILTASMGCTDIFHATAAQRAEAFLRAIGKWEDGK